MPRGKTVVIHQPDFLPYLGYFHRLMLCDQFVFLDHVQFSKGGWHNRDKIKTPEGVKWLTVPVVLKGKNFSSINEVMINNRLDWRQSHLDQLRRCYGNAPGFPELFPEIRDIYMQPFTTMIELNIRLISWLMVKFSIEVPVVRSSTISPQGKSNEMVVDILTKVNATEYLSGIGARNYFNDEPYDTASIRVIWQDFNHPVYEQPHGEFVPYLSSIDLLFNCGVDLSRYLLRSCL